MVVTDTRPAVLKHQLPKKYAVNKKGENQPDFLYCNLSYNTVCKAALHVFVSCLWALG